MKGFTMLELMAVMLIVAIITMTGTPTLQGLIARQQVNAATNDVLRLIQAARGHAFNRGGIYLCDGHHACQRFQQTDRLELLWDQQGSGRYEDMTPISELTLNKGISVQWRRFRGNALVFHADGRAHYQNGHFLICNRRAAQRIVINWVGRPRAERVIPDSSCQQTHL